MTASNKMVAVLTNVMDEQGNSLTDHVWIQDSDFSLNSHLLQNNVISCVRLNTACVDHYEISSAPGSFRIYTVARNTGSVMHD